MPAGISGLNAVAINNRLWFAETNDLFAPVKSSYLEQRIPAQLRGKDAGQGSEWFGYSTRARVVVYNKLKVKREDVDSHAKLADPKLKGQFCSRSGSHPYNLSLFGSYLEHAGPAATEAWLKGLVANQARDPKGGDTDQIKAVAAGVGDVAISNTYYLARILASPKPEDQAIGKQLAVFFPNQGGRGTHVNVSGAGVLKTAPHRENAVKLIEFMTSPEAQRYFADVSLEYPVNPEVPPHPVLVDWGTFKQDQLNPVLYAKNSAEAAMITDRCGWR